MLVLGRTPSTVDVPIEDRRNEIVLEVGDVVIKIYLLHNNRGDARRIGIDAPESVKIVRGEIYYSPFQTAQEGRDGKDDTQGS